MTPRSRAAASVHPGNQKRDGRRRRRPALIPSCRFPVRPWVEPLEDRTLLSADPISATQAGAINAGLSALSSYASALQGYGIFAVPLPIIDQSIGQLFNLQATLNTDLTSPTSTYLSGASPTDQGLVSALNAITGLNSSVTDAVTGTAAPYGFTFNIPNFTASESTSVSLDLGAAAQSSNILIAGTAPTIDVTTSLSADLSFSVDASGNFSVSVTSMTVTASVSTGSTLNFNVDFGFLGGSVQNGTVSLGAGIGVSFGGSSVAVTTSQLNADATDIFTNQHSTLVTLTKSTNSLTAALPVSFTFGGNTLSGTPAPEIDLSMPDVFSGAGPNVSTQNFGNLADFGNLTGVNVLGDLDQLGGWFQQVQNSPVFGATIPFTNTTVGQVIDLGAVFGDRLVSGLVNIQEPSLAPQATTSGGGTTGGSLAAGTYVAQYTYVDSSGESAGSPQSSSFTITAGEIPQLSFPTIPAGDTMNVYLAETSAGQSTATLYQSGVTTTTLDLSQAQGTGASVPSGIKRAPLFSTAQALATLINTVTGSNAANYNPATDQLTFGVNLSETLAQLALPMSFQLNLGSLAGVASNADLLVTPTINLGFTFGLNLAPQPATLSGSAPLPPILAGSPEQSIPTNGQLGADASFTLSIDGGAAVTVSLPATATSSDTSVFNASNPDDPTTLVGQINLALQTAGLGSQVLAGYANNNITLTLIQATSTSTLAIGIPNASTNPMGTVLGFQDGTTARTQRANGTVTSPLPGNGQLGAASSFTLTIGSNTYNITLSQSATSGDTSLVNPANPTDASTLVGQLNLALAGVGLYSTANPAQSIVVAGYQNGNITFTLEQFSLGQTLQITFANANDPMATVLGFFDGDVVHTSAGGMFIENLSADASLAAAVTTPSGSSFATATFGPVGISITNGAIAAAGNLQIQAAQGSPVPLSTLLADLSSTSALESLITVTPTVTLTATLSGVQVTASSFLNLSASPAPSMTITALDPLGEANTLTLPSGSNGQPGGDLYFQATIGQNAPVSIHLPQATTSGNTSVAQLITEINNALTTAGIGTEITAVANAQNANEIDFVAGAGLASGTSFSAGGFVTIVYQNFDQLFHLGSITVADVINSIATAVNALSQYQSLGFLNDKLPLINRSLVELVNYGAALTGDVQQAQNDPSATLQALATQLNTLLGLPPGALQLSYDATNQALEVKLVYTPTSYDQYVGLSLNLGNLAADAGGQAATFLQGLTDLVDLSGKSRLHVQAGVTVTLDLGIGVDASGNLSPFLYSDTGVAGTLLVSTADANFTATLGPLSLTVQNGSAAISTDGVSTTSPATINAGIAPSAGNPSLSSFVSNISSDFATTMTAGMGVDLPLYLNGTQNLGPLTITVPTLSELFASPVPSGSVQITTPDLNSALSQLFNLSTLLENPTVFLDPLNNLLGDLAGLMGNQILDANLPLVGSGLSAGASFITTIQNDLLVPLDKAIKAGGGNPSQSIATAMTSALGSLLLSPVTVTNPDPNSVQFNVDLGQVQTYQVPFNLGLPALGLNLGGNVTITLHWSLLLDFGVSLSDGLYLVTDPTNPTTGLSAPVVSLGVGVTLPGTGISGSLGFLSFSANTVPAAQDVNGKDTGLTGTFAVNLNSPANDGRLSASQFIAGPLSDLVSATFNADAYVDLAIVTSIGGGTMFPSFSFNFVMDWPFANWQVYGQNASSDPASEGSSPQISLDNVSLELGSFISSFVTPILNDIEPVFNAIRPVMNVLTQPIPVISDLAGQPITLITLAEDLEPQYASGINAFLSVYNLFNSLYSELGSVGGGKLSLDFGNFDLNALIGDLRSQGSVSSASFNLGSLPSPPNLSSSGISGESQSFLQNLDGTTPGSIQFPILHDPLSILQLLMGQTVNLFVFNTPTLTLGFNYQQQFPIFPPLFATLGGSVSASIHFQFGYDTYGIQEWAHSDFNSSALPDLLDGFYVVAGTPNVVLNAGITAGASISLAVASAGVEGGIFANIDMSLVDVNGTGKDRLNDIIKLLENDPLGLFDVSGSVYAQLQAYFDINLFITHINKTFNITPPITLVSFSYTPPNPTIVADQSGSSLSINTGPTSANRQFGNTNQGDQTFTVSHVGGSAGNEVVSVTAYGQTTTYSGVGTITYGGGLGNDTIDMSGVQSNTILTGGEGHNTIIGGSGYNTIVESGFSTYNLANGLIAMGSNSVDIYQNIQDIQLTGPSSGNATFNVANYIGNDTLIGQGNNNTYNIAFSSDGTTTIQNTGTGDTANIVLGQGSAPVTVTPTSVSQGVNTVDFGSSVTALNVDGTASNTSYTIQNTPGNSCTTTLNTGDGNDAVYVLATSGPTIVNAGAGTDVVDVGSLAPAAGSGPPTAGSNVGTVAGPLTVNTQIGVVTLNVDDSGDAGPKSATLTQTTLIGLGMGAGGITYNNLSELNVYLGTGGDTVGIQGTQQYNLTTFLGAPGSAANTFNVGSISPMAVGQPPTPGSILTGILGALILQGTGIDTANIDDTGDTSASSAILTSSTLTGLGMVPAGIIYSGLATLAIDLGTGGDTVDVASTYSGTTTTINAQTTGSAANTFNVGSLYPYTTGTTSGGVVSTIAGHLIVNGSGADTMNVDDTGDAIARSGAALNDTTLTGLGMGALGITFNDLPSASGTSSLHTLTIRLGPGGNANFTVTVDQNLPYLTTVDAGTAFDTATVTYQHNQNGILNMIGFKVSGGETVVGDLAGLLDETQFQDVPLLTIGGNVLPTARIIGVTIDHLIVDGSFAGSLSLTKDLGRMDITGDMSGSITVAGNLGTLNVQGGTPGTITAATVGNIAVQGGYGPVVLQVNEGGVQRRVDAAPIATPYPQPMAVGTYPTSALLDAGPAHVNFQFLYEGHTALDLSGNPLSLTNPQLTVRVTNNSGTTVPFYDLSLDTWSPSAAFNLARLDTSNAIASGIRDISIDGSLLTQISTQSQQFLSIQGTTQGGVILPHDNLGGIGVRDYAPPRSVEAASVQSVAAGEFAQPTGRVIPGNQANFTDADLVLTPGSVIHPANTTLRVPFSTQNPVGLFFGTLSSQSVLGLQGVVFTDQQANSPLSTDQRGEVTALVTIVSAPLSSVAGAATFAGITSVAFNGNGGSMTTNLPIAQSITSTGPLGDLNLTSFSGLKANVTAPAFFGNINVPDGPISGTILATGTEIDPITAATSAIDGSIGRVFSLAGQNPVATQIVAGYAGITGKIVTPNRLLSQVMSHGAINGLILAQGDIGSEATGIFGQTLRLGGVVSYGPLGGQIVTASNLVGDVTAYGGMISGRIAAGTGILGNLTINSRFTPGSAIVSGGEIGDPTLGTSLAMRVGGLRGFVAALGSIRYAPYTNQPTSETFQNPSAGSTDALAIDALFTQLNQDITNEAYTELAADLYRLKVSRAVLNYS